jgi:hypothetical protein
MFESHGGNESCPGILTSERFPPVNWAPGTSATTHNRRPHAIERIFLLEKAEIVHAGEEVRGEALPQAISFAGADISRHPRLAGRNRYGIHLHTSSFSSQSPPPEHDPQTQAVLSLPPLKTINKKNDLFIISHRVFCDFFPARDKESLLCVVGGVGDGIMKAVAFGDSHDHRPVLPEPLVADH